MLRRLCVVAVLAASALAVITQPATAYVTTSGYLLQELRGGLNATDLVVDRHDNELIVAGTGGIVVLNPDGPSPGLITSPTHVGGLALNHDESTLWYSSSAAGVLTSAATADLASPARSRHLVPNSECPTRLVVDGSEKVWFLYHPCGTPDGAAGLGSYDPVTDQFDLAPALASQISDLGHANILENNPAAPNTLVVASDSHTTTIDTSTGVVHSDASNPTGARDIAVTSDGARFVRAESGSGPVYSNVTSVPADDPASTTNAFGYDGRPLLGYDSADLVAVSGDDAHVAVDYGGTVISYGAPVNDRGWIQTCSGPPNGSGATAMAWLGTSVWFIKDMGSELALEQCEGMTTPESVVEVTGRPAMEPRVGATFPLWARVFYRGAPLVGARIAVHRSYPGHSLDLPDLITDSRGRARLQVTALRRYNEYGLTFAGDDAHPAGYGSIDVTGRTEATSFVTELGRRYGKVDRRLTIRDRLVTASGHGLAGRTVQVTRHDSEGWHHLPDVTTGRYGRFAVTTVPRLAPVTWYHFHYGGEPAYLRARNAVYRVSLQRLRPDLSISVAHPVVRYGQKAAVRVHLGPTYRNRTVRLYLQHPNGRLEHLRTGDVDQRGDLRATLVLRRSVEFVATFGGDAQYDPDRVMVDEQCKPRATDSGRSA